MTTAPLEDHLMLIGGKATAGVDDRWLVSIDPATEDELGRVPAASAADVELAVTAAKDGFELWRQLSPGDRAARLKTFADRMRADKERLAELETRDTGNPIWVSRNDVESAAQAIEYFAGLAYETKGTSMPSGGDAIMHVSLREPFGVVARILPFNHPLLFAATKLAAPLVAGNSLLMKPSEQSPLSSAALGSLLAEELPPGVVNIVTGLGRDAGDAIVRHPDVRRVAFIGSVPTGLAIQRSAAEVAVKHVSLELGGKNPMIVFPDADLGAAMAAAVKGMNFAWQGQSCGSTSRLFLHDSVFDEGLERLRELVGDVRLGNPLDPASTMGPINSKAQFEKDLQYIAFGHEEGARLLTGGGRPEGDEFARGFWLEPTVFYGVTPAMRIFREEIFGPVLSVIRWSDREEVIAMANAVEYGLTAAIWTRSLDDALVTARRVQAGYCWVNGSGTHYPGTAFGGVKNSGVGREEGLEELLSYTEEKVFHILLDDTRGGS